MSQPPNDYEICEDCGSESEDVEERLCPFAEEIEGIEIYVTICDNCYRNRILEI